jgi:hypothetical protein
MAMSAPAQAYEVDTFVNNMRDRAFAVSERGVAYGCRSTRLAANDILDWRMHHQESAPIALQTDWDVDMRSIEYRDPNVFLNLGDSAAFNTSYWGPAAVPYNTVLENTGPFTVKANSYTVATSGNYQICASLANFVDDFDLYIYINGKQDRVFAHSSYGAAQGCRTISLKANDSFQVRAGNSARKDISFAPNRYWNWMQVTAGDAYTGP